MPEEHVNLNGPGDDHEALDAGMESLLRARVGACPPPDRLFAAMEEVLPDPEGAMIRAHAGTCPLCQTLLSELDPNDAAFTPGVDARIRARIDAEREVAAVPIKRRSLLPWGMAAAAVLLLATGVWMFHPHGMSDSTAAVQTKEINSSMPPIMADPPIVEMAEMTQVPPLAPPTGMSLTTRGAHAAGPSMDELLPAFRAYNRADYATAAKDLAPLAKQYPTSEIPTLYLGVAELETGANEDALATLEKAQTLASPVHHEAAGWYLGVAQLRNGKKAQAAESFSKVCAGPKGPFSDRSCELAKQFTAQ